ncbi:MAG: DUF4168 domain-containing protein [Nitrospirae bacterium]|nr:DUF4168 domain-containing protein [Nitrospirota bacterium]
MGIRQHTLAKCAMVFVVMAAVGLSGPTGPSWADTQELETFIRARIEIGETMIQFMREQGSMERPVEKLRQMEEEINAMVARVLESYGLTIEEYRERSPRVFADEAAANAFLEEHPDLKKRYEVLPLHQAGGRYGAP